MYCYKRHEIEDEQRKIAFYRVSNSGKRQGLLLVFAFDKMKLKKERWFLWQNGWICF